MSEEIITAGRFKDDPEFKELEKAAYLSAKEGKKFDLDSLSANEYKYFDKLIKIYQDYEKNHFLSDAEQKKAAAYSEYAKETNEHLGRIIDNLKWRDNVKASETLRQRINKSTDKAEMLTLAIECISAMTSDESFLKTYNSKLDALQ